MPNDYTVACQSDTARWQSSCESSHAWRRSAGLCGLVGLGVDVARCACGGMRDARPRTSRRVRIGLRTDSRGLGSADCHPSVPLLCEDWLTMWVVQLVGEVDFLSGTRVV